MGNIFFVAALIGFGLADVAHAGDFDGPYVAFGIGSADVTDSQTNYETFLGGFASGVPNGWTAILNDRGSVAAFSAGFSWTLGGFLVGVEGRVERRRLDVTSFELDNGVPSTDYTTRYVSDRSKQVSLRVGKVVQPNYMAYFRVGRAWSNYTRTYQSLVNVQEEFVSGNDTGNVFGIGIEFAWLDDWNVNVDLSKTVYDRSVTTVTSVYQEDAVHELNGNAITFMLVKRF